MTYTVYKEEIWNESSKEVVFLLYGAERGNIEWIKQIGRFFWLCRAEQRR